MSLEFESNQNDTSRGKSKTHFTIGAKNELKLLQKQYFEWDLKYMTYGIISDIMGIITEAQIQKDITLKLPKFILVSFVLPAVFSNLVGRKTEAIFSKALLQGKIEVQGQKRIPFEHLLNARTLQNQFPLKIHQA